MNPPPLNSTVLYGNALYQIRNGTRNKITKAITLYLCTCTDTHCGHTKTPAPLEEVTQLPQVADRICHFNTRKPCTVTGYKIVNKQILIEAEGSEKTPDIFQLNHIDLMPEVGDEVVVAAKPYCEWVRLKTLKAKNKSFEHRQLIASLNDLSWMSAVFTVRLLGQEVAVVVSDGQRREIPVEALRVLKKKMTKQRESVA